MVVPLLLFVIANGMSSLVARDPFYLPQKPLSNIIDGVRLAGFVECEGSVCGVVCDKVKTNNSYIVKKGDVIQEHRVKSISQNSLVLIKGSNSVKLAFE